jgi:hypothetical protein
LPVSCHIDFSVFLSSGTAFGNVDGVMELPFVPRLGERLSFLFPGNGVMPLVLPNFSGIRQVESVVYNPSDPATPVLLSLETVTLATSAEALALFQFFKEGFGLHGNEYGL